MNGQSGTIVELDPIDALGWIELDLGGRVRFGGTTLKGFPTNPGVGTRVEVRGKTPGYKGVLKAVEVRPLFTLDEESAAPPDLVETVERTRYRLALAAAAASAFNGEWLATETDAATLGSPTASLVVERFITRAPSLHVAMTSGLGLVPCGEGEQRIELAALCPRMSTRIVHALALLAQTVHAPGRRSIGEWDRLVFAAPIWGGIAGAIMKPLGTLAIGDRRVALYDLLPIVADELSLFRQDPAAHGAWVDERLAAQDYAELHRRWERVFEEPLPTGP